MLPFITLFTMSILTVLTAATSSSSPLVIYIDDSIMTIDINQAIIIPCQDMDDYFSLLYTICIKHALCSELYDLRQHEDNNTLLDDKNRKRFKDQLTTINLYIKLLNSSLSEINTSIPFINVSTSLKPFIMQETWPLIWMPPYVIHIYSLYDTTCQSSLELNTNANITFVYITTNLLQTYKSYMANQNICNNHNEHLRQNENGEFSCECKPGKDCTDDVNFQKGTQFLLTTLLIAVLLAIFSIVITTVTKLNKLRLVSKLKTH
jgi:hypothetical protein